MPNIHRFNHRAGMGLAVLALVLASGSLAALAGLGPSISPGVVSEFSPEGIPIQDGRLSTCLAPRADGQAPAVLGARRQTQGFALELLGKVAEGNKAEVVQVSPFGVTQVLLALDYGGDPAMKKAILKVLRVDGGTGIDAFKANARLLHVLAREKAARFGSADALFLDKGLKLKPGLAEKVQAETATEFRSVDFSDPAAIQGINDWAKEKTGGRISEILSQGEKADLVALNAFTFIDCWRFPFDPALSGLMSFRLADGQETKIPSMKSAELTLPFAANGDWLAVELPYTDDRFALTLITNRAAPLRAATIRDALTSSLSTMTPTLVTIEMPKFTGRTEAELLPMLAKLGLGDHRQLPGFGANVSLSAIKQKTMLKLDEQGTEAAAVTAGIASRSAIAAPVNLSFAQPFIYMLRHKATGTVLLSGLYQGSKGQ